MTDNEFWQLIEQVDVSQHPNELKMLAPWEVALRRLPYEPSGVVASVGDVLLHDRMAYQ